MEIPAAGGVQKETREHLRLIARASSIGLAMALAIVIGMLFGWYLDLWLGTKPWLFLVFFGFGIVAAFRNLFVLYQRTAAGQKKLEEGAKVERRTETAKVAEKKGPGPPIAELGQVEPPKTGAIDRELAEQTLAELEKVDPATLDQVLADLKTAEGAIEGLDSDQSDDLAQVLKGLEEAGRILAGFKDGQEGDIESAQEALERLKAVEKTMARLASAELVPKGSETVEEIKAALESAKKVEEK